MRIEDLPWPTFSIPLGYSYFESLSKLDIKGSVKKISHSVYANSNFHKKSKTILFCPTSGSFECILDQDGKLRERIDYYYNQNQSVKRLFSDEFLVKTELFDIEGNLTCSINNSYDGHGNLVLCSKYFNQSVNCETEIFEYDSFNSLIGRYIENSNDTKMLIKHVDINLLFMVVYYELDKRKNIVSAIKYEFDSFRNEYLRTELKVDSETTVANLHSLEKKKVYRKLFTKDNRVKYEEIKNDNLWQTSTYQYNNSIIEKVVKDLMNDEIFICTEFYENGKIIKSNTINENGSLENEHLWIYGKFGLLEERTNFPPKEIYKYEYEFDRNENWIIKSEIVNGKLFKQIKREIVYW